MSSAEMAEWLEISRGYVDVTFFRALERMREEGER
jgi:DNA-directed RNA polymerase specialized sigma24 family protein